MEKRLEIKLPAEVVEPVFGLLVPMAREDDELAIDPRLGKIDADFREIWTDDLKAALRSDCGRFLDVFDRPEFRATGVTDFDGEHLDAIIRACSALRLKLRTHKLTAVADSVLEEGEVDFARLNRSEQTAMVAYMFLGSLQEIMIRQIDAAADADDEDDEDEEEDGDE